ncbi:hypothetical protein QQS21_012001 [Conoideocrella luteorostrata]|uniref:Phospholipase D n=1 Tax=Conoideocrella luteorostrata TaxID=1105319 RepID=A0AAJ0FN16_9HYPO|nr:hypothetical protein QQS21_012001 [Conoideocrella luteorostrata]
MTAPKPHGPRPFYAIAHRVLTSDGVKDAVAMGANALEIDVFARKETGWWADHDGVPGSAGDYLIDLFEYIARQRRDGGNIIFVWLDIKNPDHCDSKFPLCSIDTLRDNARNILEMHGISVLYGFESTDGAAYRQIQQDLTYMEAVNVNGKLSDVVQAFNRVGPAKVAQRTLAYGYFYLPFEFGDCTEERFYTCTELSKAVKSKEIALSFGWTSTAGQGKFVNKLLDAGIDGLIFGFKATHFFDHGDTRSAFRDIMSWIATHPKRRYLANVADNPW